MDMIGRLHAPASLPSVKDPPFALQFGDWVVRTKFTSRRYISILESLYPKQAHDSLRSVNIIINIINNFI
jgi:hypothetical protein